MISLSDILSVSAKRMNCYVKIGNKETRIIPAPILSKLQTFRWENYTLFSEFFKMYLLWKDCNS